MTSVRLQHVSKVFERVTALSDINLKVEAGELFFLLGPSGCGKSTLLRLIAGLHEPTSGKIYFNDRDVTPLDTEHRNAVMCFQSYALWPHMTVAENVRFGLSVRGMPRDEQARRVDEVLALVRMKELAARKPNQLSGGQQQRVALARALAVRPDCLLLDEPLSNLDAQLRLEMRGEIRRICKTAGFTTIYVTHDQKEAMSIADRIAVMNMGKLEQVGTARELYLRPTSSFVASFMGPTNLTEGKIIAVDQGIARVQTPIGAIAAAIAPSGNGMAIGDAVTLSIRPEQLRIADENVTPRDGSTRLTGIGREQTFLGEGSEHVIEINGVRLKASSVPPLIDPPPRLAVEIDPRDVVIVSR